MHFNLKFLAFVWLIAGSAILSNSAHIDSNTDDEEYEYDLLNDKSVVELLQLNTRGLNPLWIWDEPAKNAIKNMISQFACGWPDYNIPPLAPYTNQNLSFAFKDSTINSLMNFHFMKVEGLETLQVKDLKLTVTFNKKAKFHIRFDHVRVTASQFQTSVLIDMLKTMGFSLGYNGTGPLSFTVHDLEIWGSTKFTLPIIWGSVEIYKFQSSMEVGSVKSNIGLLKGNTFINDMANQQIERLLPHFINNNKGFLNPIMEKQILPMVNKFLKGTKIWNLIGLWFNPGPKCVPKPAPWMHLDEQATTPLLY